MPRQYNYLHHGLGIAALLSSVLYLDNYYHSEHISNLEHPILRRNLQEKSQDLAIIESNSSPRNTERTTGPTVITDDNNNSITTETTTGPPVPTVKEGDINPTSTEKVIIEGNINPTTAAAAATTIGSWPSKLSWLLSFPNSGSVYITDLIQKTSMTSMATNYATDVGPGDVPNDPLFQFSPTGPFRYITDLPFPQSDILTNTHCTGYCLGCGQETYVRDVDAFHAGCSTGSSVENGVPSVVQYDPLNVKKMVHLIRSPMDNIVARFHFGIDNRGSAPDWNYSYGREGFRAWCRDLDAKFDHEENSFLHNQEVEVLMTNVPCSRLFYQYAQWHNNVFDMANIHWGGEPNPVLSVHFEDFEKDSKSTTEKLMEFLDFEIPALQGEVPSFPFWGQQTYSDYYTEEDIVHISAFLKVLSAQQTWALLKRYFPFPILNEEQYSPVGSALSQYFGVWPDVAWLLSFPNSGTFYTTQLTQMHSRMTTATNYGNEAGMNFLDMPNFARTLEGPYRASRRNLPSSFILTKTHCSGRCYECSPEEYVQSPFQFLQGCATGGSLSLQGEDERKKYDPTDAKKVVHLIRNPFDNVVARFHYMYKFQKTNKNKSWNFGYNQEGFRSWCRAQDEALAAGEKKWYSDDLFNDVVQKVPCHGEIFQYIQWHNNAFTVPVILSIPSLVLHYQDFQYNSEPSIKGLFDFLELPAEGKVPPFTYSTYPDYFTDEERTAVFSLVKILATEQTFQDLERYFPVIDDQRQDGENNKVS